MEAITGDETGLIKTVSISKREFLTYGTQDRNKSVEGLTWLNDGYDRNAFAALRANSCLEVWKYEPASISILSSISLPTIESPLTVSRLEDNNVICVGKLGHVSVVRFNDDQLPSSKSNSKKLKGSSTWDILESFQVKGPVGACATCKGGAVFGGAENDVVMYDIATQKPTWSGRNVPYDTLRLRVPIWVAAISFLNIESASSSSAQFVTGTGHKHIRLYDIKAGQQPSTSIEIGGDYRVTSIQPTGDGNAVFVADCSGGLGMWDLRMTKRKISVLKGSSGSIRALHLTPSGNNLASIGLDRFLRVYDTSKTHSGVADAIVGNRKVDVSSKLVSTAYLKNRLNCCLLTDTEVKAPKKSKKSKNRGLLEDDDMLKTDVNFDSEDDDEEGSDEDDDDDESGDGMMVDEDDDDDENDDDDDEEDEEDDDEDGGDDEDDEGDDDDANDSDESNDDGDDSDADRKGSSKGQFSSRKERVAKASGKKMSSAAAPSSKRRRT